MNSNFRFKILDLGRRLPAEASAQAGNWNLLCEI